MHHRIPVLQQSNLFPKEELQEMMQEDNVITGKYHVDAEMSEDTTVAGTVGRANHLSSVRSNLMQTSGSRPQTGTVFTRDALGSRHAMRTGTGDHGHVDDSNASQIWFGSAARPDREDKQEEYGNSFTVYEDKDLRKAGIINFLSKVGSIQDLDHYDGAPLVQVA